MNQNEDDVHKFESVIEQKLESLMEQYNNPAEREKLELSELLCVLECMVEAWTGEKGQLYEKSLHVHLWIVLKLLVGKPENCVKCLKKITGIMCELSVNTGQRKRFIDAGLQLWLFCLQNVSAEVRFERFRKMGNKKFENCIDFLINAHCLSSQFQMLQILCLFVENGPDPLEQLWPLFANKLKPHTLKVIKSIKWCTHTGIPLERQLFMLDHINQMHTTLHGERWIYSELIESIKFDDRTTIPCPRNDGKLYMNKLNKSVELLMSYESEPLLIHISAKKLKNVQIVVDELYWVHEMRLEFNAPPSMCNKFGTQITPKKMDVRGEYIDVMFDTGFNQKQLMSLLSEMFGITPHAIKSESSEIVSDTEYDSDIEIVGVEKFENEHLSTSDNDTMIITPMKQLPPANHSTPKPIEPLRKGQMVVPKTPASVAAMQKVNQKQDVFPKPKTPQLRNGSIPTQQSTGISSGSFYGKKKTTVNAAPKKEPTAIVPPTAVVCEPPSAPSVPSAPRRPRRASAQAAMGNIRKTMEQSQFDFDENDEGVVELKRKKRAICTTSPAKKPKRTKKPAEPPKWPVLNIEIKNGKKQPRRLHPIEHDLCGMDDDDKSTPKTPKMVHRVKNRECVATDLTPSDFRSSHFIDPKKAANRVLENVMKINERAHKNDETMFNPNVSFSYRHEANKNRRQKPSPVIFSQADSTSPNLVQKNDEKSIYAELNQVAADGDDDGMDVDVPLDINCNHEKDAHRQKKRHLKKVLHEIKDTVVQALEIMIADDSDDENAMNKH